MIEPVPVEDYIEHLWQSVKEGYITWSELNDLQATFLASQQPIPISTSQPSTDDGTQAQR